MRPRARLVAGASLAIVAVAAPAYAGPGAVGPGGGVVGGNGGFLPPLGQTWIPDPSQPIPTPIPEPPVYGTPPQDGPTPTPAPQPRPVEPGRPERPDPQGLLDGAEWQVDRIPDDAGGELLCVTQILPNDTMRAYGCVPAPIVDEEPTPEPEPKPAG